MFETFEAWDRAIVLAVNGCHSPIFDQFFWFVSATISWIPLYIILAHLIWKTFGWQNLLRFLVLAAIMIAITDLTAKFCFKEVFLRARPSHNLLLEAKLHYYRKWNGEIYKGGDYGFISSHATNFFALTVFVGLALKQAYPKLIWILLGISLLVCYSRMYLGVHYLTDLIAGAIWGSIWGYIFYRIFQKIKRIKT